MVDEVSTAVEAERVEERGKDVGVGVAGRREDIGERRSEEGEAAVAGGERRVSVVPSVWGGLLSTCSRCPRGSSWVSLVDGACPVDFVSGSGTEKAGTGMLGRMGWGLGCAGSVLCCLGRDMR